MNEDTNKEILKKLEELEEKISSLESKSEQFSSDVRYMRSSIDSIRELTGIKAEKSKETVTVLNAQVPPVQQQAPGVPAYRWSPRRTARAPRPPKPARAPRPQRQRREGQSLEQFIGKNAMGIGASVLVFIAMVMFATLLMPYIGQELKCAAMYIFSFMLIGFGEWIYRKQKNSYLILSACGMGALFISLFATKIYFRFIDSIPLYILLFVWVGVTAYLALKRHMLFAIIGQIGIFTALSIAAIGIIIPLDLYLSFAFMIAAESVFFILFWKKEYKYNLINSIGLFATLSVFASGAAAKAINIRYSQNIYGALIILACIFIGTLAAVRLIHISDNEKRINISGIVSMVNSACVCAAAWSLSRVLAILGPMGNPGLFYFASAWCYLPVTVYLIAVLAMLMKKQGAGDAGRSPLQYICFALVMLSLALMPSSTVTYLIAAALLLLAAYNYRVNQKDLYYVSQAVVAFAITELVFRDDLIPICLVLLISLAQMIYSRKKNPGERMMMYEYISYVTGIILMFMLVENAAHLLWTGSLFMRYFAIIGLFIVIQIAARETDWTDSDNGRLGVFHIANLAGMMYALGGLRNEMTYPELIFYSLITLVLFSLNLGQLLEINDKFGAYIGIKYTVLAAFILNARYAVGYVYSIVFLAISIVSVVLGFRIKNKSLRLYGLVLSMISIFKLITIDISYSNTLMRAVSFLISGLICFGISLVYNRIDKQHKEQSEAAEATAPTDRV